MKRQNFSLRRHQRGGLFDSLFGSGDTEKTTDEFSSSVAKETSKQTGTITDDTALTTTSKTSSLSGDLQEALNAFLLQQISIATDPAASGQAQIADIANLFAERAVTAEEDILKNNAAIIEESRRLGEKQVNRLQTSLAQQAGGTSANSFVAGATGEAIVGLESSLASLSAELSTAARGIQASEMQAAIEALRSGTADAATRTAAITTLTEALKGAEVSASEVALGSDERTVDLATKGTTTTTTKGTQTATGDTDTGIFGSLISAIDLLQK